MTKKSDLLQAQEALAGLLDSKLGHMPEWIAFRTIQRLVLSEEGQPNGGAAPKERARPRHKPGQPLSYTVLTDSALKERGKPIPTPLLMEFIGKHRDLGADLDRAKINVTSTLSKSPLFQSVAWEGGRAWWYKNKPVPK